MKLLLNSFVAFLLLISAQTCNNTSKTPNTNTTEVNTSERMEITGTIEQQGMTSYQYGTHTITTADDEYYALKSEAIELDDYLNEEVTIVAEKIEGYPLSGGPDYLLVLEVK